MVDEELTERQREAVVAVLLEGMPISEVARRMGTTQNALYKLLLRRTQKAQEADGGRRPLRRRSAGRSLTKGKILRVRRV